MITYQTYFVSEEYDIEVLCTIFDNFVLGNTKAEATPENPCKLAIMNNILKKDLVKMEVKEEVEVVWCSLGGDTSEKFSELLKGTAKMCIAIALRPNGPICKTSHCTWGSTPGKKPLYTSAHMFACILVHVYISYTCMIVLVCTFLLSLVTMYLGTRACNSNTKVRTCVQRAVLCVDNWQLILPTRKLFTFYISKLSSLFPSST